MPNVIINGVQNDQLKCDDRGLLYGDGLFETIALKDNKLLLWQSHMDRLSESCELLKLEEVAASIWLKDIQLLNLPDSNCIIKLLITRGSGGRGYRYSKNSEVCRIVSLHDWPNYPDEYYEKGIKVRFCDTRVSINSSLAGLKHINRLENVMARNEWRQQDIQEGLMQDDDDFVIEGTMTNLFAVRDNTLYTPKLNRSGVKGVLRQHVMNLASACGLNLEIIELTQSELLEMHELFVCNSVIGIWPIRQLADRVFDVGEVTRALMKQLNLSLAEQTVQL